MSKSKYLHGYTSQEQARLEDQARLLEPYVYEGVEFKRETSLLEVGCGIGAQSKILLKRFSSIKQLVGIDISEDQLRVARETLAQELLGNRLELHQSDARDLAILKGRTFDGAFLCWFLEHVPDPLTVLRELRKYLIPGSEVILSEVNNSSFLLILIVRQFCGTGSSLMIISGRSKGTPMWEFRWEIF
ncbi:MAG: class I SAM-dependent methyltransferase [Bdellovibrionales bacterium]|nr:class I SAM-dependent methyltransferase [Bdellovibrionales bacterium]